MSAGEARAQVAVAPLIEPGDAVHRDIVGAVARALGERWEMLSPQLSADDVKACKDDVNCVLDVAKKRGATYAVIVSVAPLGARDEAVAVQLYATGSRARLLDESAVLSTARDVRAEAAVIGRRVSEVLGPPERAAPPVAPVTSTPVGPLSYVGAGLLGAALAVGVAGVVVGSTALGGASADEGVATWTIIGASAGAGALALGGVGLLAADGL